ncbi:MAG: response regulator [Magnetococcales bacterium]|nr:response regulator [Magnetococcales bacterium]
MGFLSIRAWPLLTLLVIPFTLLIFLAGGVSGYLSYTTGQQAVQELTQRLMTETSGRIQSHIQSFFKIPPSLVSLNSKMWHSLVDGHKNYQEVERIFFHQTNEFQVRSVFFGDEKGRGVAVFRENDGSFQSRIILDPPKRIFYPLDGLGNHLAPIREIEWDPRPRPWYVGAIKLDRPVWSPVYTFTDGVLGITVSRMFKEPGKPPLGVIGVDLDLKFISDFLRSLTISPSGQAFILEPDGAFMAVSSNDPLSIHMPNQETLQRVTWENIQNPALQETIQAARKKFGNTIKINQPQSLSIQHQGQKIDIRLTPFQDEFGLDLIVGVMIPEQDFMVRISENAKHSFQVTLFMLTLSLILGFIFSRSIAHPIHQLAEASKKMAGGDYQQTIDVPWSQELIILSHAFTLMAQQVWHTIKALENLNLELEVRVSQRTADLAAAKIKAEEATRSKSQFLANMSHEIRSPMNAIIGMTDLVLQGEVPEEHREYLKIIQTSGESLLSLINSILDFSKIEAGKLEIDPVPFNLRNLLEESTDALAVSAAKKGLEILCDIRPNVPEELTGDSLRLRQILINLVNNGIKFTSCGEIVIRVANNTPPTHAEAATSAQLHFSVSDTGIGIPNEKLAAIFDDFSQADQTTTRKFGGTGLGLTISKRLVELMGGRIWVESELGKGSVFNFLLPLPIRQPASVSTAALQVPDLASMRVLVVESNETVRRALADLLSQLGVTVTVAENSLEAIHSYQNAARNHNPFVLALINSQLPDLGGTELVKRAGNDPDWSGKFLVMLSATHRMDDKQAFLNLGVAEVLRKPIKKRPLLHAILRAIGQDVSSHNEEKSPLLLKKRTPRPLHILVADDQRINQKLAVDSLTRIGHRTTTAENGREVLKLLASTPFDIILMDVQMPEMDGFLATRAIRAGEVPDINPNIPIVAVTANAMKEDEKLCLAAGMDDFLSKPFKPAALWEVVERIAARFGLFQNGREEVPAWLRKKMFRKPETLQAIRETDVAILARRQTFLTDILPETSALRAAVSAEAWLQAQEHARTIKDAAGFIGAAELKNATFKLILAMRGTDKEKILLNLALLLTEMEQLQSTLSDEQKTRNPQGDELNEDPDSGR